MNGEGDPALALPKVALGPDHRESVAVVCDYALDFIGGAQTAMLSECRSLIEAGARVVLIVPTPNVPALTEGLHVLTLPSVRVPFAGLPIFANSRRMRSRLMSLFRREGVTAVHVHSEFGLAVAALDTARELGLPSVATVHTFFWSGPRGWFARPAAALTAVLIGTLTRRRVRTKATCDPVGEVLRGATKNAAALASIVISPSKHQADALCAAGVANVRALPNTVHDLLGSRSARAIVPVPVTGPLRLLWIGRCAPEKRLIPFVEACVLALDSLPEGALVVDVVGDGPDLVRAQLIAAGVKAIRFHGAIPNVDVPEFISRSHVVALTSNGFDNQPMVVVEALREGRGVLYVDVRLSEGLEVAGIIAPADPAGFAKTIRRIYADRELVASAGDAARRAFRFFAPAGHAEAVLAMYVSARPSASTSLQGGV